MVPNIAAPLLFSISALLNILFMVAQSTLPVCHYMDGHAVYHLAMQHSLSGHGRFPYRQQYHLLFGLTADMRHAWRTAYPLLPRIACARRPAAFIRTALAARLTACARLPARLTCTLCRRLHAARTQRTNNTTCTSCAIPCLHALTPAAAAATRTALTTDLSALFGLCYRLRGRSNDILQQLLVLFTRATSSSNARRMLASTAYIPWATARHHTYRARPTFRFAPAAPPHHLHTTLPPPPAERACWQRRQRDTPHCG